MRQAMARATVAVLAAVTLILAGCSSSENSAGVTSHAHDAAASGLQLFDPASFESAAAGRLLINVHVPDEGSLPGTDLALPYNEIDARITELPADTATPLAIYCMSGNMSAIAGQELRQLGYTDVIELDGGMRAWQDSGRTLLSAGS